jgi:ABC-type molybdenum transport system ATPase subunit/photorepair protein PhrA
MSVSLACPDARGILLEDVSRSFGHERVLGGVSLRSESSRVAAFGGPNGSGKTTLLRILAGVLLPDSGSVVVCGRAPGRGLAGEVLLIRAGYSAQVRIGVAKDPAGKLEAHAWVESDGRVVIGDHDLHRFTTLGSSDTAS